MKYISHRGNIDGSNPADENHPAYIQHALDFGFDVEVDVWWYDDALYLGHDEPQYPVPHTFTVIPNIWYHCKTVEALQVLLTLKKHCFWHDSDDHTITSHGYIWTYPGSKLVDRSIAVLPEVTYNGTLSRCSGICSDVIKTYRRSFSKE